MIINIIYLLFSKILFIDIIYNYVHYTIAVETSLNGEFLFITFIDFAGNAIKINFHL